jgi:hypothetical protein
VSVLSWYLKKRLQDWWDPPPPSLAEKTWDVAVDVARTANVFLPDPPPKDPKR